MQSRRHTPFEVGVMTLSYKDELERQQASQTIDEVKSFIGLSVSDLAQMWDVDRRTVLRYSNGETTPKLDVRKSLDELREMAHLLRKVFPREKAATEWLYTPEELLRGRRPADLVVQGETTKVIHVLAGFYSGAHL